MGGDGSRNESKGGRKGISGGGNKKSVSGSFSGGRAEPEGRIVVGADVGGRRVAVGGRRFGNSAELLRD